MAESIPMELDVFSSNPYQLAVTGCEDVEIVPVNTIDGTNVAEFFSIGYNNKMKKMDEIFLSASIQLVKADGKLYEVGDSPQGHIINSILNSLFKSCSLYLNNTLVYSINDNYGLQEYIQQSLNYSPSVVDSKLSNAGLFTPSNKEKLKTMVKGSKNIELMAKLNLMNVDKLLLPNVNVGVKLGFQNADFYIKEEMIKGAKENDPDKVSSSRVIIKDMKLHIKHVVIRDQYLLHIETSLAKSYLATYEFKISQVVTTTLAANQNSVSVHNLYNGIRPSMLLMCFIPNKAYVGSRASDPYKFTHHNLKQFCFTINNENVPKNSFNLSVDNKRENKYAYVFHNLYRSLGLQTENVDTMVDRENFLTDFFYITSDISHYSTALTNLNDPLEFGNIGFNATFASPLAEPLTAILYVLLPRKVEIGRNRSVNIVY